jgi:hypothetical protein
MPDPRREAAFVQQAQRAFLIDVDDHRLAGLPAHDERDDTVLARRRVLHRTLVTIDDSNLDVPNLWHPILHGISMTNG